MGLKGDSMTTSLITPMTVYFRSRHFMVNPTGFFIPMYFAAVSLITTAELSVEKALEKSRPSLNCQPTVFP